MKKSPKSGNPNESRKLYVRNFVFGVEDSLVSTVGMLSGVAVAGLPRSSVFISGLVLIFVEAFSMGVGSYLSEDSTEDGKYKSEVIRAALIMFISYFIAGFIPLTPYYVFDVQVALPLSIALSLVSLFILGLTDANLMKKNLIRSGIKMLVLGGLAIAVGITVGNMTGVK